MLRELSIRNFAIIGDLTLALAKGLNILTGETGAGKSIIVNAVKLIMGGRASADLIRTGEDSAELEALFYIPKGHEAAKAALGQGLDIGEDLVIRRIIQRSGRHKTYINGRVATTQNLAGISQYLASISGQHANQNLTKADYHLAVLDQFGKTVALRDKVTLLYQEMRPMLERLKGLEDQLSAQSEKMSLLRFQLGEIEKARITMGEDDALETERRRLKNAEKIFEMCGRHIEGLYGGDGAIVEQLSEAGKDLRTMGRIDPALVSLAERLDATSYELTDIATEIQSYVDGIVFDNDRLEAVEQRLHELQKLKRKYGDTLEAVIAFGEKAKRELKRVSSIPQDIAAVKESLDIRHTKLVDLCRELSKKRKAAALRMAKSVEKELASLGMAKTQFQVRLTPVPLDRDTHSYFAADGAGIDPTGMERAELLISANVGEALKPVAQIASGGELSRLVLAFKTLIATKGAVETVIFDEVDSGIGGRIAEMVGEKLDKLARFHQVICITHLAQIARFGRSHFKIEKQARKGRTVVGIVPLSGEDRVQEMARMLGGAKTTEAVLAHAREMIETSET